MPFSERHRQQPELEPSSIASGGGADVAPSFGLEYDRTEELREGNKDFLWQLETPDLSKVGDRALRRVLADFENKCIKKIPSEKWPIRQHLFRPADFANVLGMKTPAAAEEFWRYIVEKHLIYPAIRHAAGEGDKNIAHYLGPDHLRYLRAIAYAGGGRVQDYKGRDPQELKAKTLANIGPHRISYLFEPQSALPSEKIGAPVLPTAVLVPSLINTLRTERVAGKLLLGEPWAQVLHKIPRLTEQDYKNCEEVTVDHIEERLAGVDQVHSTIRVSMRQFLIRKEALDMIFFLVAFHTRTMDKFVLDPTQLTGEIFKNAKRDILSLMREREKVAKEGEVVSVTTLFTEAVEKIRTQIAVNRRKAKEEAKGK
jgi:hypothetical protein